MKESVGPVEPIVVEEKPEPPKQTYKSKEIVKCPDCNLEMTQHMLNYIHKRRGFCKADIKKRHQNQKKTPEPVAQQKPKITQCIVNYYIKEIQMLLLLILGMKEQ